MASHFMKVLCFATIALQISSQKSHKAMFTSKQLLVQYKPAMQPGLTLIHPELQKESILFPLDIILPKVEKYSETIHWKSLAPDNQKLTQKSDYILLNRATGELSDKEYPDDINSEEFSDDDDDDDDDSIENEDLDEYTDISERFLQQKSTSSGNPKTLTEHLVKGIVPLKVPTFRTNKKMSSKKSNNRIMKQIVSQRRIATINNKENNMKWPIKK